MARSGITMTLRVTMRWWVYPYLYALTFLSFVAGYKPDDGKVASFIANKGIKMKVVRA